MKNISALLAIALVSTAAHAAGEVTIETFETRVLGLADFDIYNSAFMFNTNLYGGAVALATPSLPAHSGLEVYTGTWMKLSTESISEFCWPGIGAWVSGTGQVYLKAYEYDPGTQSETELAVVSIASGTVPGYLSIGSVDHPRFITSAIFYSDSMFAIDDLTLGIEGISPGIPEPASWALMLLGFGSIAATMRLRPNVKMTASQVVNR